jgi:hypothetical protein
MDFENAVRFLVERGAAGPVHNSDVTLLEHVLGTYRVLERWGQDQSVLAAGLFHSVYSTQNFPIALASYDEREAVRAIAGERAERLAFLFCVKDNASLFALAESMTAFRTDVAKRQLRDWRSDALHAIAETEVPELLTIVAANAVEQLPRSDATLRRDAPSLRRVRRFLPSAALASLETLVMA